MPPVLEPELARQAVLAVEASVFQVLCLHVFPLPDHSLCTRLTMLVLPVPDVLGRQLPLGQIQQVRGRQACVKKTVDEVGVARDVVAQ